MKAMFGTDRFFMSPFQGLRTSDDMCLYTGLHPVLIYDAPSGLS